MKLHKRMRDSFVEKKDGGLSEKSLRERGQLSISRGHDPCGSFAPGMH